ncbi:hypothetical protein L3081_07150 [Colwellia sp. MSW7]|uniref:Ferrous iron transport protein B C-terminal domain-containing protein n=1 Tax=Colwellia maritima TaxID=2912588 RepID=A0ABS9WZ01_9GAMM|nr:hypothetical protein [Colwellia maritima]MCI2283208.1 hypothetical protein [Colwellia maritima]
MWCTATCICIICCCFFPDSGQNLVFLLYLIGIAAAIFTGFLLKKTVLSGTSSLNIMELPPYEVPQIKAISKRVWHRTYGFVTGVVKQLLSWCVYLTF